jgi:hypothetical protein
MTCRAILGWTVAAFCLFALPAWAVEYRLEVTNIDRLTFSANFDKGGASSRGQETMQGLEARLDNMDFSTAAVLPGRELQLLEDPAYGGTVPGRASFLPATGKQSWTTVVWDGTPGERVAFVVKSDMVAWQEVYYIAANANGVLRRLTIGGPGLFGGQTREVPDVSKNFLATAADQRIFASWLQQNAKSVGGMSFVIGRRNEVFHSADRVYMLITQPSEPHTFKVVIGWRDHDDRGTGDGLRFERMRWRP